MAFNYNVLICYKRKKLVGRIFIHLQNFYCKEYNLKNSCISFSATTIDKACRCSSLIQTAYRVVDVLLEMHSSNFLKTKYLFDIHILS
jgi:hypothetical protein